MTMFLFSLKRAVRTPVNIIVVLVLPYAFAFLPPLFEGELPHGVAMYGLIVLFSAFLLSRQLIDNRSSNTITRIAASPTSHFQYLLAHLLAFAILMILQNTLYTIVLWIRWGNALPNIFAIWFIYVCFSIFSIAFALFWNSFFRNYLIAFSLFSAAATLLALISGISMPLSMMPESFNTILPLFPTYWLAYGLDVLYNGSINLYFLATAILLIFSVIFFLIGSKRRF